MVAYNDELAERFANMELMPSAGLLYPSDDAKLLDELRPHERPEQLVILDGTWHQAKTLFRDIERLQQLPRYRLAPSSPGRYRIRREPNEHALSTLEATVVALSAIEPATRGLERLIETFDRMIGDQIERHEVPEDAPSDDFGKQTEIATSRPTNWRRNERRRRGSANVPRVLTGDLDHIVVAYGEREPGRPIPVYWTAIRLGSGERFECAIRSDAWDDAGFMAHLNLDARAIEAAVSVNVFRELWRAFLRPNDRLAIEHFGTSRLLETIDAAFSPVTILKSINVSRATIATVTTPAPTATTSTSEPGHEPGHEPDSRASIRLQAAVDYVYQLNSLYRAAGCASD